MICPHGRAMMSGQSRAVLARSLDVTEREGGDGMAQAPRELTAAESACAMFGAELRHWRNLRGLSQSQLGELTHDSGAQIGKVEKAQRWPNAELARRMDAALQTGGVLEAMWPAVNREHSESSAQPKHATNDGPTSADLGLQWSPTAGSTVDTAVELWKADMRRRTVIAGAAWAMASCSPAQRWLQDPDDADLSHVGRRRVGQADIDTMWTMCSAFAATDHHLGGGYARSTLVQFLDEVVGPLLNGTYDDAKGRQLFAAAARLADICGFMSFDSGRHGLAQRYFVQALRLAKASGNRALGAHILADMSMPALHLGRASEAVALAEAGSRTAQGCGAPSIAARCLALEARAYAASGAARVCHKKMRDAESALERAHPSAEPVWNRFFTERQLGAEFMYASSSLGEQDRVRRLAPDVIRDSSGMERRQVLVGTRFAASYVDEDIDHACAILRETLPAATGLTSTRGLDTINAVRRKLAKHSDRPAVQQVEQDFRELVGTTA